MAIKYWGVRSHFVEDYQDTARPFAILRWLCYIPAAFIFYCCYRRRELVKTYKTSIIYAAFAQFLLSLPMAVYYVFLGFFVGEGIPTTALACTLVHHGTIIAELSAHLVITTIAVGRFFGVVFGLRLSLTVLNVLLLFLTAPHFAALSVTLFEGRPIPYVDCSPLLFFLYVPLIYPYSAYMYLPPVVAVLFNLGTLGYVTWHKSRRVTEQTSSRARDEYFITLGLLAQSIIPAITVGSKGYFMTVEIFRFKVPAVLYAIVEVLSVATVGLNTLALIVFIRPFRMEFLALIGRPFKQSITVDVSTATTMSAHNKTS